MDVQLHALIAAFSGCGISAIFARYTIIKALGDLDKLAEKVSKIDKDLTAIAVHLEKLSDHDNSLKEIQKKLSYLEGYDERLQRNHHSPH